MVIDTGDRTVEVVDMEGDWTAVPGEEIAVVTTDRNEDDLWAFAVTGPAVTERPHRWTRGGPADVPVGPVYPGRYPGQV